MTSNEKKLEEYCRGREETKKRLQSLLKFADSKDIPFEDIDIEIIKFFLRQKRTEKGFLVYMYTIKSFYKYLGCDELVEKISEIQYSNKIKFFVSITHLLEEMESKAQSDKAMGIIADEKQYDRSKICALLYALGLSDKEIVGLKQSDYSFEKSVLIVGDKTIPLIREINETFNRFSKTKGYRAPGKQVTYAINDYFIRMVRSDTPTGSAIYNLAKTIYKYFGIQLIDIKKSREMWELFKQQGFDLNFKNVIIKIDWDKFVLTDGKRKRKHMDDETAFIKTVAEYKKLLQRK